MCILFTFLQIKTMKIINLIIRIFTLRFILGIIMYNVIAYICILCAEHNKVDEYIWAVYLLVLMLYHILTMGYFYKSTKCWNEL